MHTFSWVKCKICFHGLGTIYSLSVIKTFNKFYYFILHYMMFFVDSFIYTTKTQSKWQKWHCMSAYECHAQSFSGIFWQAFSSSVAFCIIWDEVPTMVEIAIFWFQIHITNGMNFMHRKWHTGNQYMVKSAENQMRSNLELLPIMNVKSRPRYSSALKKSSPVYLGPKNLDTILKHWMSVKLADNFQIREHSWPCLFHIK